MREAFAAAFAEWDRRFRQNPEDFADTLVRILKGGSPESYGDSCAIYFTALLDELGKGKPWNTIASSVDDHDVARFADEGNPHG